jgi:hypothetical protein
VAGAGCLPAHDEAEGAGASTHTRYTASGHGSVQQQIVAQHDAQLSVWMRPLLMLQAAQGRQYWLLGLLRTEHESADK